MVFSNPSSTQVASNKQLDWWIIDPDPDFVADDLLLYVTGTTLTTPQDKDVVATYPLPVSGTTKVYPIVESAVAHKATTFSLTVDFLGDESYELLKVHRAKSKPLLLNAPHGEQWWFVFGERFDIEMRNLAAPVWRFVTFDVVEVYHVQPPGEGVRDETVYAKLYTETY